jgi:hypothetical protein
MIEREYAGRDGTAGAQKRKGSREQGATEKAEKELAELKEKSSALKAEWQKEKAFSRSSGN